MEKAGLAAVIIGASSGIGEALARDLYKRGWRLGLLARRMDKLKALAAELGSGVSVGYLDVSTTACVDSFHAMAEELGGVDLVIISAGCGHLNPTHESGPDQETISVNVIGFMAMAQAAFRLFQTCGHGHLAAITSVAALRGNSAATAYAASKAFQSAYLDGLRESTQVLKLRIAVTELQPGFVETAMLKTTTPLPLLVRRLFVCDVETAARQMLRAIFRNQKHAYITKRYALIAFVLKFLPRPGRRGASPWA
jgi:short-subunit dehydrogenase